ncbi:MAG TPA: NAD(P)-dependent oxidoreductase [Pseudonocardiaceae bacterium]|jgi:UDP-glucose 4-epimerase|nr:NAD(P)-dependent oxidoreductase [Pseudonocardiaceae bacterium]
MILVTGGLGFIGSHVTRALVGMGESCVVVQRRAATSADDRVIVERGDVTDQRGFLEIGARYPITGIVHLAGAFGGDPVDDVRANVDGLLTVLTAAREWRVDRLGVASTLGVYGGVGGSVFREDMPLPMVAGHAIPAAKKIFELVTDFVGGATGLDVVNYRIGAIWGPGGRTVSPFFSVPQLVHSAVRGTPLDTSSIHAEGGVDICYVKDCARGIALLQRADALKHRTYNIGSGYATTNADLVAAIRKAVPEAHFDLRPGRAPHAAPDFALDISRIHDDTGYTPVYDLDRAVADYVDWLRTGNER